MKLVDPRSILSLAWAYRLYRSLVIGPDFHSKVLSHLELQPGARILDLGCGTGNMLESLPDDVEYLGVDASAEYIEAARRRFGDRHRFQVLTMGEEAVDLADQFDLVTAYGLLHHLDDRVAAEVVDTAFRALAPGGRAVSFDPVIVAQAPLLAKLMVRSDRGTHVRRAEEYRRLFASRFSDVEVVVRHDLLRVPFVHAIVRARVPA